VTSLTALQKICINELGTTLQRSTVSRLGDLHVSLDVAFENQLLYAGLDKPVGIRQIPKNRPPTLAIGHGPLSSMLSSLYPDLARRLHITTEFLSACAAGCCRAMFSVTETAVLTVQGPCRLSQRTDFEDTIATGILLFPESLTSESIFLWPIVLLHHACREGPWHWQSMICSVASSFMQDEMIHFPRRPALLVNLLHEPCIGITWAGNALLNQISRPYKVKVI
jgi:hypothetical protein